VSILINTWNILMPIKRINRTNAEQKIFCNTWNQSGLSKIGFCKQNNISKSALYSWLNKFNNNNEVAEVNKNNIKSPSVKFLQINDVNKSLYHEDNALEIIVPNGIKIRVNASQSNLSVFLQELLKWK
jgi:hypothetical protein